MLEGEHAYLRGHRVKVLGRYQRVGSGPQRVWVSDLDTVGEETVACDETELLTPAEFFQQDAESVKGGKMDYSMLPEHMQGGAKLYIERGVLSGHFLTAVLENNFVNAHRRADEVNVAALDKWAEWLLWEAPGKSWGSPGAVARWMERQWNKGDAGDSQEKA